MLKKQVRTIYYNDELNDEFADDSIKQKRIDENYKYNRNSFTGRCLYFFWYRIIAFPIAYVYLKLHFNHKIVNRKVIKKVKGSGYFIYGNHTHFMADALIPTFISVPKRASVLVHPNNVSMPFLGKITPYLGALPLPDNLGAGRNFIKEIEYRLDKKNSVMIYPEAHIWPFYTGIRPFVDMSFKYPVKYNLPVFSLTNTYQKQKYRKTPRIVTYIDGPFYPDGKIPLKDRKTALRNCVYEKMIERAANNNVQIIHYIKQGNK